MAVPFIPIFPICFQCGTDQNPCRCKVVGPTIGMFRIFYTVQDVQVIGGLLTGAGFVVTILAAV